jgi:hypothetical protein
LVLQFLLKSLLLILHLLNILAVEWLNFRGEILDLLEGLLLHLSLLFCAILINTVVNSHELIICQFNLQELFEMLSKAID